jgi:cell division protein FtsA
MSERINIVAAVDVGTNTTICLIGWENEGHKIEILGHAIVPSAGIRRGIVLNIDETVGAVKKAIAKASENLDVEIKKLYVNVVGQHLRTVSRTLQKSIEYGKIITKADIRALYDEARSTMQQPGDKVYHVVNQSYTVDGETAIQNPIGIAGSELRAEYRLIVGPENYEEKINTSLRMGGYEMVRCMVNPIAAAEAVISDDEKEAGVMVVDLGGGTTSMSVYYENVLRFISVLPFGGNVVTLDIKEGCNILLRHAESLKVQYGAAIAEAVPENRVVTIPSVNGWDPKEISFKSLSYIIQARMEEIVENVAFQLGKSGFGDKLGAGVVLTGGGAKLDGLKQLVRFKTGMDVRIGFPIVTLTPEQEKVLESPMFATAFGLLKKAVKDENAQHSQTPHTTAHANPEPAYQSEEMIAKPKKKVDKPKSKFGDNVLQRLSLFFNEESDSEL